MGDSFSDKEKDGALFLTNVNLHRIKMNNKICILAFCSALLGVGTAEAAYVNVTNATANGTLATALNLDAKFDKAFDLNIGDANNVNISTSFSHASVNAITANGGNGVDWYKFTTTQANMQAYFDIDLTSNNLDSSIKLYNSIGVEMAFNDNTTLLDSGSSKVNDSFISQALMNPGIYYVSVGKGATHSQLTNRDAYTLHISLNPIPAASPVPVPAAVWLFGSGLAGLLGLKRKKIA